MQLGITMRINGAHPTLSMDEVLEAERLGYVRCGRARPGHRRGVAGRVGAGTHHEDQGRHCDHADAGAHAVLRGDDGDDAARTVRRTLPAWRRPSGPQVIEGWHGVA